MAKKTNKTDFKKYRHWARSRFDEFKSCIAFVESADGVGDLALGTCFHVGDGVFVTARHVVESRKVTRLGFDDFDTSLDLLKNPNDWGENKPKHGSMTIESGPHFHPDASVDVACFKARPYPKNFIPLGGHLDDWLGQYDLVLYRTLILGYPRIPLTDRPVLLASLGEVNALVEKMAGKHPYFIVSTMARGGFSGAPALVAYNEDNDDGGTAALGLVTESFGQAGLEPELGFMAVLTVEPIYACLKAHHLLPKCQEIGGLDL